MSVSRADRPHPAERRAPPISERLAELNWPELERTLWAQGFAETPPVLTARECESLIRLHGDASRFRSSVDMQRHGFGEGDYHYFAEPLPRLVAELRTHGYAHLAPIANRFAQALGQQDASYPATHEAFRATCAAHGQTRPTPLLLHYEAGGFNCLHQDLYGELAFPFQLLAFLGEPGRDYTGGELLLVEQRPRAQSVGHVVVGGQGRLVLFTTRIRPRAGRRGFHRVNVRHGVSRVHSGTRYTLGVIFHDAR